MRSSENFVLLDYTTDSGIKRFAVKRRQRIDTKKFNGLNRKIVKPAIAKQLMKMSYRDFEDSIVLEILG